MGSSSSEQTPETKLSSKKATKDGMTGMDVSGATTPSSPTSVAVFSNGTIKEHKLTQPPYSGNLIITRTPTELSPPRDKNSGSMNESKEEHVAEDFVGAHLCHLLTHSDCEMSLSLAGVNRSIVVAVRGSNEIVGLATEIVAAADSLKQQERLSTKIDLQVPLQVEVKPGIVAAAGSAIHEFFHARAGADACLLAGRMRITYAILFILDRILWSVDLKFFYYNDTGVIPTRLTRSYAYVAESVLPTIFDLAPESDFLVWLVNYLGLLQGILLLLGIAPRFQCACLVFILASFEHQNDHAHDAQDVMLRFFAFLMCFLPLHRLTLFEWWQTRRMTKEEKEVFYKNDSWPMWPFRLWQIEIIFIYWGAGFAKLSKKHWWRDGLAVYHATFTNHFGGFFTPDFLFNNLFSLKLLSYGSLLVECLAFISVWPLSTRIPSLIAVVLLHIGIDFSMNMNIFEWLSILGWMPFLVKPIKSRDCPPPTPAQDVDNDRLDVVGEPLKASSKATRRNKLLYMLVNVFITLFLVVYASVTFPTKYVLRMTPAALEPFVEVLGEAMDIVEDVTDPWLDRLGIHQQSWNMFSGYGNYNMYERFQANVRFQDGSKTTWWSPDWASMSWLERKRNRRRQLYYNNLESYVEEDPRGQKHLCELIAKRYDKDVEKVKLYYHYADYPKPSKSLGWFEPIRKPGFKVKTKKEVQYIYYNRTVCDQWADRGDCFSNPSFMGKRCKESCASLGAFADSQNVKVGSRVLVYIENDSKYYPGTVMKVRKAKSARFFIEWDYETQPGAKEAEWLNLDRRVFHFVDEEGHSSTIANNNGSYVADCHGGIDEVFPNNNGSYVADCHDGIDEL